MSFAQESSQTSPIAGSPGLTFGAPTQVAKHPAHPPAEKAEDKKQFSEKDAKRIASEINDHRQMSNTELNFSVDKETEKMLLKVIDSKTGEVIRQIPADEALHIAARISKLLGILVDGKS